MNFLSAPSPARVIPPAPPIKQPAYAVRLAQHIAMGRTPAQAMQAIERADGHFSSFPASKPLECGGKGKTRPNRATPVQDRVMPHITREWQCITPELCEAMKASHDTIRMTMKRLVEIGKIECSRGHGHRPSMWRLVE